MRKTILLLLAALLAGIGLGTLLGTGQATAELGPAGLAANTALVQNSRVQSLPTPEPLDIEEDAPLLDRAELALERLREEDYPALAAMVHPVKGVTLTPFSTVSPGCASAGLWMIRTPRAERLSTSCGLWMIGPSVQTRAPCFSRS